MSSILRDDEPGKARCFCPEWLIDAVYETVHRSPVRVKVIAARLNLSTDAIWQWGTTPDNPSMKHRCIHLRWVIPLCQAAENTYLMDAMERQLGRAVPQELAPYDGPVETLGLELTAQLAEALYLLNQAHAHGGLTAAELVAKVPLLRIIRRSIDQVERAIQGRRAEHA